ncbi:MAG: hypothetical protein WCL14_01960 [Bacteroidota bacterium]
MHKIHPTTIDLYVDSFILLRPYRSDLLYSEEKIIQIKQLISEALNKGIPDHQLASDLGHLTNDWGRDWRWIAHHITLDHFNYKKAQEFLDSFGDTLVYKNVYKEDCKACKKLYLKNPDIENDKEPKIYKLSELILNGDNLNPKFFFEEENQELKPVVGASIFGFNKEYENFYWDHSTLSYLPKGEIWDDKLERFEHIKLEIIGRNPIHFTVTLDDGSNKDYYV